MSITNSNSKNHLEFSFNNVSSTTFLAKFNSVVLPPKRKGKTYDGVIVGEPISANKFDLVYWPKFSTKQRGPDKVFFKLSGEIIETNNGIILHINFEPTPGWDSMFLLFSVCCFFAVIYYLMKDEKIDALIFLLGSCMYFVHMLTNKDHMEVSKGQLSCIIERLFTDECDGVKDVVDEDSL